MLDLFKVFSNESKTSKSVAKERLKLVLVHDRVDCSPKLLDLIKTDILKVIANYAEIEECQSLEEIMMICRYLH